MNFIMYFCIAAFWCFSFKKYMINPKTLIINFIFWPLALIKILKINYEETEHSKNYLERK